MSIKPPEESFTSAQLEYLLELVNTPGIGVPLGNPHAIELHEIPSKLQRMLTAKRATEA